MLALILLLAVPFQHDGPQTIQPRTLSSPSGEWTARTDPSSKFGDGPSRIRVSRGEQAAWEAEVPFTYWEAQLSDSGQLAGYGFTEGPLDMGSKGDLVIAIFAPDGRKLLDEHHVLERSRFLHCPPNPRPMGQFTQPALDRFVLRVDDEDVNRRDESWWIYRLSTGEALGRIQPKQEIGAAKDTRSSMEAHPIAGTPLTLVQWFLYVWDENEGSRVGTRFTLLGEDGKPVWTLDLAGDYVAADEEETDRRREEAWEKGGILAAAEAGRFELRHVAAGERVSYAVEADPASESGWTVRELARAPFEAAVTPADGWPTLELSKIASVPLDTGRHPATGPVHDVVAFDFDTAGAVQLVRSEATGGHTLLMLDAQGQLLRQLHVDEFEPGAEGARAWHWIENGCWLFTLSPYDEDVVSRAWLVDTVNRVAREIADFAVPSVGTVERLPGGGFALLSGFTRRMALCTAFMAFDAAGRRSWGRIETGDDGSESNIYGAQALAVDSDGSLLLLGSNGRVQVFDSEGRYERTVELGGLDKHAYLTSFLVEPAGTWLVFQFSSEDGGQWHRFSRDGVKLASFAMRDADGTPGTARGPERIDPSGGLWCTDGQALFRLDESGVLRPGLGSAPDADVLEEAWNVHIDDSGRVAVIDRRSHSIHLFQANGERELVLHPDPTDFEEYWFPLEAFVSAPDGRLFVPGGSGIDPEQARFLVFATNGRRVGWTQLGGDLLSFRADGGRWVAKGSRYSACSVTGFSPAGEAQVSFARRPNGDFHLAIDAIDCRPDGSLALLTGADDDRLELDLYSPAGEPLRTIDLHAAGGRYWNRLSQNESWILVSSFESVALLLPRDGGVPSRVRVNEGTRDDGCAFTLSPDGAELWCATREPLALHRYALPESH